MIFTSTYLCKIAYIMFTIPCGQREKTPKTIYVVSGVPIIIFSTVYHRFSYKYTNISIIRSNINSHVCIQGVSRTYDKHNSIRYCTGFFFLFALNNNYILQNKHIFNDLCRCMRNKLVCERLYRTVSCRPTEWRQRSAAIS